MRVLIVHKDDADVVKANTTADGIEALSTHEPEMLVIDPDIAGEERDNLVAAAESQGITVAAEPQPDDLGVKIPGSTIQELEKHAILETLKSVGGSTSKAAKILGISVRKIQYRLRDWRHQAEAAAGDTAPMH